MYEMNTLRESLMLYLLLIDVMTDSNNMFFAKTNETINLDNFIKCDTWKKDYKDVPKTFVMLIGNIGYYYCPSSDTTIFIFAVDKDMTFESSTAPHPLLVGSKVTSSCYVTFQSGLHNIRTLTRIHDSVNLNIITANDSIYHKIYEKEVKGDIQFDSNGTKTYFCTWSYGIIDSQYKGELNKNISFRVYMPPTNVRPDVTDAQVNKTRIICLSEADPPASKYSWECFNVSSISISEDGSSIKFEEIGVYNCTCVAANIIDGADYNSRWNGIISVSLSSDEFRLVACGFLISFNSVFILLHLFDNSSLLTGYA